ncbi:MAG TPA: hypothetical protein VIU02_09035, partial [Burkholderiales bacterium]
MERRQVPRAFRNGQGHPQECRKGGSMHAAVRSLSVAGLLIVLIMASGCATVVKGSKQNIGIQT